MTTLPKSGRSWSELDRAMDEAARDDVDWRRGRIGVYIHYAGEDVLQIAKNAYLKFFSENGLGPKAFPSLAKFESDVIGMTLSLLHGGPGACGAMTTGGTESIFLVLKAARDRARALAPHIERPQIVLSRTAHPAFDKAAHCLGLEIVRVPPDASFRADPDAMAAAIGRRTILLVGSAPAFPHGVVDPIAELGELAQKRGLWLHVDACVGGYIAPFARQLGAPIADFDFAVAGVTSISADLHKYGYAAKGASSVLYRDEASYRYQGYEFDAWSRGRYSTQTLVGTRPGGAIAAAWAVMNYLGEAGYLEITRRVLAIRQAIADGVAGLGLTVWGKPELGIIAFGSHELDIAAVADGMSGKGWYVGRTVEPPGIHLMLNLTHEPIVAEYLGDLAAAVETTRRLGRHATSREATY